MMPGRPTLVLALVVPVLARAQDAAPPPPPAKEVITAAPRQGIVEPVPTDSAAPPPKPEEPSSTVGVPEKGQGEERFYKGDLGTPGAPELENPNDAFFVGVGYYNLGGVLGQHYARLTPSLDLHFSALHERDLVLRFEAPVNVLAYDARQGERESRGAIRKEDYDELGDFLGVIKRIALGRKEDNLYVNVGRLYGASVGHGSVVRRYNGSIDADRRRVGLQLDAYGDYGGFETFLSDLSFQSQVMGGLVFVKPLSFITDNETAKTLSIGAHYTTDLSAPRALERSAPSATDPYGSVKVDDAGFPEYEAATLGIFGADIEWKPIRLGNAFDLKIYGDFSKIVTPSAGSGLTAGLLLRSNLGARPYLSAFRVRLEGRNHTGDFAPHYFDSLYEVQKLQFVSGEGTGLEPTKYTLVTHGPSDERFSSVYGEAAYELVNRFVLGLGLGRMGGDEKAYNLLVHLEVPAFEFLRFYASYQKLNFTDMGDAFALADSGKSFQSDALLQSQVRLMLLPILFINVGAQQAFIWDAAYNGGAYRPKLDLLADVQLGYEFD